MADSDILILPRPKPPNPAPDAEEAEIIAFEPPAGASQSRPAPSVSGTPGASPAAGAEPEPHRAAEQVDLDPVKAALMDLAAAAAPPAPADPREAARPQPHAQAVKARIGVLIVNLGTPDAAEPNAVRRYLRQFLTDPRVIERNGLLWRFVLRFFILPFRPRAKAKAYQKIWNTERNESPLKTITRAQAEKLSVALTAAHAGADIVVDWAMRYASPSIEERFEALVRAGCDRILLLPLYPQYSSPTTATACDVVFRLLSRLRRQPTLRIAPPYYADAIYVDALADSIEAHLRTLAVPPDAILVSYHGMPVAYVRKGDPYEAQCMETTRLLRDRLGRGDKVMMSYQSRFGGGRWLQPATSKVVRNLARQGVRSLAVVTPGFSADCLETLEEIGIETARVFKKAGGEHFTLVPCLNDSEPGMTMLAQLVTRELQGWV